MKKTYISLGIVSLMFLLVFSSCNFSQEKDDSIISDLDAALAEVTSLQNELDVAETEVASLQDELDVVEAEVASLQDELGATDSAIEERDRLQIELNEVIDEKDRLQIELNTAIDEKDDLVEELIATVNERDTLQNELDTIKSVGSLGGFNSVSELSNWVQDNKQPYTNDIEALFRTAIEVQRIGLQEGYLISVIYEKGNQYPNNAWVYNGALVNGSYYVWDPCTGNFYYWFSNIL